MPQYMEVIIEQTADGSSTLYRQDIDEHYHSVKGALAESRHVYLDLCWRKAADRCSPVIVFEVGFGTGLNAALTAKAASESHMPTIYYSVELYPLDEKTTGALLLCCDEDLREEFMAVNAAAWGEPVEINRYFTLIKIQGDLLSMDLPADINAVYFDAFAPEKQPEMWDERIFRHLYDAMAAGGILSTYCAKGCIRRLLGNIGFEMERLPGPRAGKREVLRASRPTDL